MSQEELSNFIYASEHNVSIRSELKACLNKEMIVEIAKKHGYQVHIDDLIEESISVKTYNWFLKSKINPIKSYNY